MVNPASSLQVATGFTTTIILSNNGVIAMSNITQVASKTQVVINDNEITRVVYKDQPVLTFAMVDQLHQRPERTARNRFTDNKSRFIEGVDYYLVEFSEKHVLRAFGIDVPPRGLTVLTQTGYAMLAKVFTDDLAWQVQRELVNKYFATPQSQTSPQSTVLMSEVAETFRAYASICDCIGVTGNQLALAANAATVKHTGINPLENMGLTHLTAETQEQTLTVSDIAKRLGLKPRQVNPILTEIGLQTSHRDHKDNLYYELTNLGKEHGIYLDAGKKHKTDGTPVKQIKWYDSAIDLVKSHLEADFVLTGGAA
jgi:hypothetical protein